MAATKKQARKVRKQRDERITAHIEPAPRGKWRVRNSEGTIISRPCEIWDAASIVRYINGTGRA